MTRFKSILVYSSTLLSVAAGASLLFQKLSALDVQPAVAATNNEVALQELVVLLVDKTALKASLVSWPNNGVESIKLHDFTVAIGKEKGDKQRRGDNRTPEGVYLTENVLQDVDLPEKYGPHAITLNYPNPVDRDEGKTGSGIWLHGVIKDERVEEANVTEGCVAFYNADIKQLTSWLRPGQGVVVIADSLSAVNKDEDVTAVTAATNAWYSAWAKREVDQYISFYSNSFHHQGMNRDQYREYKNNVFRSYKKMEVKLDKIRVLTHPKYAIAFMDQDFTGDERFSSQGRKLLYWSKAGDGSWQISKEVHENKRFEFLHFSVSKSSDGNRSAYVMPKDDVATSSKL